MQRLDVHDSIEHAHEATRSCAEYKSALTWPASRPSEPTIACCLLVSTAAKPGHEWDCRRSTDATSWPAAASPSELAVARNRAGWQASFESSGVDMVWPCCKSQAISLRARPSLRGQLASSRLDRLRKEAMRQWHCSKRSPDQAAEQ